MKTALVLVAIIGCSLALPSGLDWSKIQPNYAYVNPISDPSPSVSPRVIGGHEVDPNSLPYQAALIIDNSLFCGGSLISRSFVLSAAHCLEGKAYVQIILGAHNIREIEPTQIVVTSTRINVHPGYNPANYNNDIALVEFPNPIEFNIHIHSIPLALDDSESFEDFHAVLAGWGRRSDEETTLVSTLHAVELIVLGNYRCSQTYGEEVITDSTVCTSGEGHVGGCDGDSGSPLVIEDEQIGVASFTASSGCERGFPTGYARVSSFRRWIIENTDIEE